jgi:hypothetical protein
MSLDDIHNMSHLLYPEGDFSFVLCNYTRNVMEHDYSIFKQHNLSEYLRKKNFEDSDFIFHMRQYGWWHKHSGMSLALSLKRLEYIAKYGWDAFVISVH